MAQALRVEHQADVERGDGGLAVPDEQEVAKQPQEEHVEEHVDPQGE